MKALILASMLLIAEPAVTQEQAEPQTLEQQAREYLRAPDLQEIYLLPVDVQERIFQIQVERFGELLHLTARLHYDPQPQDFCIAAYTGEKDMWYDCLMEAKLTMNGYKSRVREIGYDNSLDGVIDRRIAEINRTLK